MCIVENLRRSLDPVLVIAGASTILNEFRKPLQFAAVIQVLPLLADTLVVLLHFRGPGAHFTAINNCFWTVENQFAERHCVQLDFSSYAFEFTADDTTGRVALQHL